MEFQINGDVKFINDPHIEKELNSIIIKKYYSDKKPERFAELDNKDDVVFDKISLEESVFLNRKKTYIFDFGTHIVGRIKMNIVSKGSPPDAPVKLKMQFGELLSEVIKNPEEYQGELSSSWIQEELLTVDTIPKEIQLDRRYTFRYIKISVVDTSPKFNISLDLTAVEETSADTSKLSYIESEDSLLVEIDKISQKTLVQCMQDVFEDGPKRDRRLWLGDLRLQARANYYTVKNFDLVKKCLLLFATKVAENGQVSANIFDKPKLIPDDTFLADYSLFFIDVLLEYGLETSDTSLLNLLYPIAKNQYNILSKEISPTGEVVPKAGWWAFVDWQEKLDKRLSIQGIFIYSFKKMIELANFVHDFEIITEIKKNIDLMEFWVLENAFNKEKKLFMCCDEEQASIASQVWLLLSKIGTPAFRREVIESTLKNRNTLVECNTPYMYHHLVEALFENGLFNEAIQEIKSYWGEMVKLGADTFWEAFNPNNQEFSPYGDTLVNSYCHAWSCTPCYLMRKYNVD
ncbi:alpha-rhamnosidase [Aerococcaceae bacterium zg-ZUI334]|uniref:alpha-L-rhamnosidase-related protein n=1 Tax=Aerococcaceae bacterium zg-252 TaxID=2796928 RepID=UPI001B9CE4CA|nr:alpha-rhamnosidase [Aerococcaceae bacterium zg-ZUI334]